MENNKTTKWQEVFLSSKEEKEEEQKARESNIFLMKQCLEDAKSMVTKLGFKRYKNNLVSFALALYKKRASHSVFWKEERCKEKFQELFGALKRVPSKNYATEKMRPADVVYD